MKISSIYKNYLDLGTNEGLRFNDESKSRFVSFNMCLEHLAKLSSPKILELGTSRSYVDGKFPGCNSDDKKFWNKDDFSKWDWGAGCFTLMFGMHLPNAKITTLDLIPNHINRCQYMTSSLGLDNVSHVVSDSISYLNGTSESYDLIYLDTGDMHPIEPTCLLQLEEVKSIINRKLLNSQGLLLIDDVLNGTPRDMGNHSNKYGKSELALPHLLNNNYKLLFEGYQYILAQG
jgi:predicted O-methyltransferase YrrM